MVHLPNDETTVHSVGSSQRLQTLRLSLKNQSGVFSNSSASALSPSRRTTGTNRQISRALEVIEISDENPPRIKNMTNLQRSPRTAFQICNNVKRKRSSLSGTGYHELEHVSLFDSRSETKKKKTLKKLRGSKQKTKKAKSDTIENALKRFRVEHFKQDQLFCFQSDFTSSNEQTCKYSFHVSVSHTQGARAYMEDRFSVVAQLFEDISTSPSLIAVYDGHNGAFAADYALKRFKEVLKGSSILRDLCSKNLNHDGIAKVRSELQNAFLLIEKEILDITIHRDRRDGTTVIIALVISGKIFIANVGDSRAVLARGESSIRLSVDHKPNDQIETKRVEGVGGSIVYSGCWRVAHREIPLRLAISRSLGDHPLKSNLPPSCSGPLVSAVPDISVLDLTEDEFMVVASDGLWDRFSDQEAIDTVRSKVRDYNHLIEREHESREIEGFKYAASSLVEAALMKKSMDNITVIIVSWKRD